MPASVSNNSGFGAVVFDPEKKTGPKIAPLYEGLDLNQVAKQYYDSVMASTQPNVDSIDKNNNKVIPAIQSIKTLLSELQEKSKSLANYLGIDQSQPNILATKKATGFFTNSNADLSQYVVVTANSFATTTTQPFNLTVNQLAATDSKTSTTFITADPATAMNLNSTLTINGTDIAIIATDSLQNIADKINALSDTTKVNGSIIKLQTGQYVLNLTAKNFAEPINLAENGDALLDGGALKITSAATNVDNLVAKFNYNNTPIQRNNNTITDLIPNVTISLKAADPAKSAQFNIGYDKDAAFVAIQELVASFNKLTEEINKHYAKNEDGSYKEDAVLFTNAALLEQVKNVINSFATSIVPSVGSNNYGAAGAIGIKISAANEKDLDGKISIDFDMLRKAVNDNFPAVIQLLGAFGSSSNSAFKTYSIGDNLSNQINGQPINITYQADNDGIISATLSCNGNNTTINNITGSVIFGPANTVFSGLKIGYEGAALANNTSVTTTVYVTQGLADKLTHNIDLALTPKTGYIDVAIDNVVKDNEQSQSRINSTKERAQMHLDHMNHYMGVLYDLQAKQLKIKNLLEAFNNSGKSTN